VTLLANKLKTVARGRLGGDHQGLSKQFGAILTKIGVK